MKPLPFTVVKDASRRIRPYILETPLVTSEVLNRWLGHRIWFKVEGVQKTGSFKIRGALNALLSLKEKGKLPARVVAFSSGNHAQGLAYACRLLDIPARIYMPKNTLLQKQKATASLGAEVILTKDRAEAETRVVDDVQSGAVLIPPFDHDDVIAGQGTSCLEALQRGLRPDAIFATCGGGGWLSGTWLAAQLLSPHSLVIGAEPAQANDAAQSLRAGRIVCLTTTPNTIADGARTLAVSERTFAHLTHLSAMIEISEDAIAYWCYWLNALLDFPVEPTSAAAMAAAAEWLSTQPKNQEILVLLSGGNLDRAWLSKLSDTHYPATPPRLHRIIQPVMQK